MNQVTPASISAKIDSYLRNPDEHVAFILDEMKEENPYLFATILEMSMCPDISDETAKMILATGGIVYSLMKTALEEENEGFA